MRLTRKQAERSAAKAAAAAARVDDGFSHRRVRVQMPTRTIVVDGELDVSFVAGRDEQYVDDFIEWLSTKCRVTKVD